MIGSGWFGWMFLSETFIVIHLDLFLFHTVLSSNWMDFFHNVNSTSFTLSLILIKTTKFINLPSVEFIKRNLHTKYCNSRYSLIIEIKDLSSDKLEVPGNDHMARRSITDTRPMFCFGIHITIRSFVSDQSRSMANRKLRVCD